jgi:hypothetical protein
MTETTRKMGGRELASRVRMCGGILEALEFGVQSSQIEDPELASVWQRLEEQYGDLRPNLSVANRILSAAQRAA